MKTKLLVGAALAAVLAASGASAQVVGWYGAIDVGGHFPNNINAKGVGPVPSWNWKPDDGFMGDLRLGYQFTPHWRIEGELGYRDSKLKQISGGSLGVTSPGGSINDWTYMGNVIYDFLPNAKISPFIGGGVGAQQVTFKTRGQLAGLPNGYGLPESLTTNDSDTKLAYQGIVGVAWRASDRLNIDLTYHYLTGDKLGWQTQTSGPAPVAQLGAFKGRYEDSAVTIGLRYS